jgi:hypothetical protein
MNRRQEFQSIKTHEFVFQDASGQFPALNSVFAVATDKGIARFTKDLRLDTLYAKEAQIDNIKIGTKSAEFEDLSASVANFGTMTTNGSATFLGNIVYNNEILAGNVGGTENCMVAVGPASSGMSSIRVSINGTQWANASGDMFVEGNDVAWNGSIWVAVGRSAIGLDPDDRTIAYSSNGVNWKFAQGGFEAAGHGIAWNGSRWVAVGTDMLQPGTVQGNTIRTSTNGINWNTVNTPDFFRRGPTGVGYGNSVAWNGLVWVAVGYDYIDLSGSVNIITSKNGLDWIPALVTSLNHIIAPGCNAVAWGENSWVVVGRDTIATHASTRADVMFGTDQSNNTVLFRPTTDPTIKAVVGNGIAWNGTMWILVADLGVFYTYSITTSWTQIMGLVGGWKGVSWNGTKWIIVGSAGIRTSYDGLSWSLCKGDSSGPVNGISARKILPNVGYALPKNIPASRNFFNASGMDIVEIADSNILDYSVILLTVRTAYSKVVPEFGGNPGSAYNQGRAYVYSKRAGVGFSITSYEYDYSTYDYAIIN